MTGKHNPAILDGDTLQGKYPQGVDWHVPLEKMTLVEMFDRAVKKYADHPCIDFYGKKISYRELEELADKAAKGFQEMGVKKGTRVGLYMPNTQYYPVLFFGALRAGAVIVNYSTQYVEKELEYQAEDSGTEILVTSDAPRSKSDKSKYNPLRVIESLRSDHFENSLSLLKKGKVRKVLAFNLADAMPGDKALLSKDMRKGLPLVKIINRLTNLFNLSTIGKVSYMKGFMNNDGLYEAVPVAPDDTAVLQYTGGTSGTPKGGELTHYNLTANIQQISEYIVAKPGMPDSDHTLKAGESRMFAPLPYFHVFGMSTTMILPIHLGLETITVANPLDFETCFRVIEKSKPDALAAVPNLVKKALQSETLPQYDVTSVKSIVTGGAAMPQKLQKKVEEHCTAHIFPGWGLTETSPVLTINPVYGPSRENSAGQPVPGVEIRVCDIDDPHKVLNMGENGELQARGPNIMKGYLNNPDATAEVMVEEADGAWFRTGDIGYVTEDGFVDITDRLKRMINVNGTGKKAFSKQIEDQLSQHSDILECCVIAVDKGTDREAAKAFIRFKDGKSLSEDDIRAHLATRLSKLEIPRYYEFVTEPLPRTIKGDIMWKHLEDREAAKANQGKTAPQLSL